MKVAYYRYNKLNNEARICSRMRADLFKFHGGNIVWDSPVHGSWVNHTAEADVIKCEFSVLCVRNVDKYSFLPSGIVGAWLRKITMCNGEGTPVFSVHTPILTGRVIEIDAMLLAMDVIQSGQLLTYEDYPNPTNVDMIADGNAVITTSVVTANPLFFDAVDNIVRMSCDMIFDACNRADNECDKKQASVYPIEQ